MQKTMPHDISLYEIIRLQPSKIIMKHRDNRKLFQYVQQQLFIASSPTIPHLLPTNVHSPIITTSGYLFQLGTVDLQQQLSVIDKQQKFQSQSDTTKNNIITLNDNVKLDTRQSQSEQLARNTVGSILEIVDRLHATGIIHGSICPKAVFIDEFGDIQMHYPGLKTWRNGYYQNISTDNNSQSANENPTIQDDYRALGMLILKMLNIPEYAHNLNPIELIRELLKTRTIYGMMAIILYVLLQKQSYYYSQIKSIMQCPSNIQKYKELLDLYQNVVKQEPRKASPKQSHKIKTQNNNITSNKRLYLQEEFTPPLIKHKNEHYSPKKMVLNKKLLKLQDCENKKTIIKGKDQDYLYTHKRKKNNDTALKKMSNCKISGEDTINFNPMILKGQNYCSPKANKTPPIGQHHTGTSPTYKKIIRDIKQTKQKQDLYRLGTILKQRLRTASKKKISNN